MSAPRDLPAALAERAESLLAGSSPGELERAVAQLSDRYRSRRGGQPLREADVRAYAASRLPATYAAVRAALEAAKEQLPGWRPETVLDLGTGLGAAIWAAAQTWGPLERAHGIDRSTEMLAFAGAAGAPAREITWQTADLADWRGQVRYDLVVSTYVLGELSDLGRDALVDRAWQATGSLVVLVEPGTPDGYRRIIEARSRLIAAGGSAAAPCPHDRPCPMSGGDWCHFAARLARSARHRAAKRAELGHEDEKFSYVAVVRGAARQTTARIVRHPQLRRGLVSLELCTDTGLETAVVSRRDGDTFKRARKASWGGSFEQSPAETAPSPLQAGPPTAED